jgi:nicotinamidase-related amidase
VVWRTTSTGARIAASRRCSCGQLSLHPHAGSGGWSAPPGAGRQRAGACGKILNRGEPGRDLIPELRPQPGAIIADKPGKGSFGATDLALILRTGGSAYLVTGSATDVCVSTTTGEAHDRSFECLPVEDTTESRFPACKAATLDMIRAQGAIAGWTATTGALDAALRR